MSVKGTVLLFFRIYISVLCILVYIKYFKVKISNLVRVEIVLIKEILPHSLEGQNELLQAKDRYEGVKSGY